MANKAGVVPDDFYDLELQISKCKLSEHCVVGV